MKNKRLLLTFSLIGIISLPIGFLYFSSVRETENVLYKIPTRLFTQDFSIFDLYHQKSPLQDLKIQPSNLDPSSSLLFKNERGLPKRWFFRLSPSEEFQDELKNFEGDFIQALDKMDLRSLPFDVEIEMTF